MVNNSKLFPAGKGQVLYARSKVYLHPTSSKKDNVPGYLTIIKPFITSEKYDYIIAYIPESDVSFDDKKTLDFFDLYGLDGESFDFYSTSSNNLIVDSSNLPQTDLFIDRPRMSSLASYAFGLTINQLFSVQVRPKTTNLWEGSIILHPKQGDRLPALFFHDDECPGTKREQQLKNKTFNPFSENRVGGNTLYWGGDRFISCLKNYATITESTLEPAMFLINCTQEDAMNFVPNLLDSKSDVKDYDLSEELSQAYNTAKWTVLTGLASITGLAKKKLNSAIESKVLPPSIQKLFERTEVKKITDDFDSANVYLAKWALTVQEEAEKNRKMIIGNDYYKDLIKAELSNGSVELTPLEVSRATRKEKIGKDKWNSFFDSSGCLQYTIDEVLEEVYHSGLEDDIRKEAWLFLLGVYPWDTSFEERKQLKKTLENNYIEYKNNWVADLKKQKNDAFWKDQKARIYKDIKRTDRDIELYKTSIEEENADEAGIDSAEDENLFKNSNLLVLRDILFSYNEININLGYVQGMSDLLSPLYYVFLDESISFWAFTRFMERMERNFVRDLSGMKMQMLTLTELVQFMLPDLYEHLNKCDSGNLFFFFRMLLVWFKREITFYETMDLWEIMWTDYYSSQFILFFALAILQKHSKIIIQTLKGFDDILKYINDLNGTLNIGDLLTRAELLFVKYKQMVELIDRQKLVNYKNNNGNNDYSNDDNDSNNKTNQIISKEMRKLLSREVIIEKEVERTMDTPFG